MYAYKETDNKTQAQVNLAFFLRYGLAGDWAASDRRHVRIVCLLYTSDAADE